MIRRLSLRVARRDSGRAIVEFLVVGLLLLVPVVYFVVTLSRVQAAAFAVSTASREAGRAFTTATDDEAAYARAQAAARISFEDYDFGAEGAIRWSATVRPACDLRAGVEAVATVDVRLPLVPDILSGAIPAVLPVSATHVATVDRFRGR